MNFCFRRTFSSDFGLRCAAWALLLGCIVILEACTGPKTVGTTDPAAPTIFVQPENQSVAVGATATFSVAAIGTAPLTYQWSKNGGMISGATDASYTTQATVAADDGATFTVQVTNAIGNVTSNAATLTVTTTMMAPSITTQPANQTVTVGDTAAFSVTASGSAPLSYQWSKNGTSISGATSFSYTTPATIIGDSGATFTVEVNNGAGNALSSAATLTVTTAAVEPSIATQPSDQTVAVGAKATFTVQASGTAPLSYQWSKGAAAITGATASSYTTPATVIGDNGSEFSVQVTNSIGNVTSNSASLTVNNAAPTITSQPKSQTVNLGATATFTVTATGTSPVTYQWLKNGNEISAATASSYTTPATAIGDNNAAFVVRVTNGAGTIISSTATLTVNASTPTITVQPKNQNVLVGATAMFSVTAAGAAPLTYQWSKKGAAISGATAASYTTPATSTIDNGATFTVYIKNSAGNATSNAATLTVTTSPVAPSIITQPASQSVTVGTTATFSVTANGTAPLTYQWSENGAAISGATGARYTTPATALVGSVASFTVTVINSVGSVTSAPANLTVNGIAPTITAQPLNQTVTGGGIATFSVTATGSPTLTYQWSKNATPINGATSATYLTPATVSGDPSATFTVKISNAYGNVISNGATLTVDATGTVTVAPRLVPLTTTQTQQFTASVASTSITATWSVDGVNGGTASAGTITTSGLYRPGTAMGAVGTHTVTATSGTQSGTATVAVTDLAGIYSFHSVGNDASRTGQNTQEYALTAAVLKSGNFGKVWSCQVDGAIYAQPLYVANLLFPDGVTRNVVYIATEHDSVYAFDADTPNCTPFWAIHLVTTAYPSVTSMPVSAIAPCLDTLVEIGITGTPVIDPIAQTLYFVAKTIESGTPFQRLHAVGLTTGAERLHSPVEIKASDAHNTFDPKNNHQKPGLAFANGEVYIGWSSHCDQTPYVGWFMSYDGTLLSQTGMFDVAPNPPPDLGEGQGGIWMSGGAPAVDPFGSVYLSSGNGQFSYTAPPLQGVDLSMSFIKFKPGSLDPQDFYSPGMQASWSQGDFDISSSGVSVLPDSAGSTAHPYLLFGSDKQANLWLLDRSNMGGFSTVTENSVQFIPGPIIPGPSACNKKCVFSTPAFYNQTIYLGVSNMGIVAIPMSNGLIEKSGATAKISFTSADSFGFPGPTPSISASQSGGAAVVWGLETSQNGSPGTLVGPAILRAYDASDLSIQLYSSANQAADTGPDAVKFTVPVVANGRVYVGGAPISGAVPAMTVYGPCSASRSLGAQCLP